MVIENCYMCEEAGVTKEHVPAKSLFPKTVASEDQGDGYRKGLITVPSCKAHNNGKSGDDEYLRNILAMALWSNSVGKQMLDGTVSRSLQRNGVMRKELADASFPVKVFDEETLEKIDTIGIRVDRERIESTLKMYFRGLYYYKFKKRFHGEISLIPFFLLDDQDLEYNRLLKEHESSLDDCFSMFEGSGGYEGDNPDVFKYAFYQPDPDYLILDVVFYQNLRIAVTFKKIDK